MPPKRATRASSTAPSDDGTNNNNETTISTSKVSQSANNATTPARPTTRASRRLRASQEPDASPLRALSPPRRKTRTSTNTAESSRKLFTSSSSIYTQAQAEEAQTPMAQASTSQHEQEHSQETTHEPPARTLPQSASSSSDVVVSTIDNATAPGATEDRPLGPNVPSWKRVQYETEAQIFDSHAQSFVNNISERQYRHVKVNVFIRPVLYPNIPQILAFENEANQHDQYEIAHSAVLHATLAKIANMMTDDEKVQVMISQRAKVVEQSDAIQRREAEVQRKEAEVEVQRKNAQKAQDKLNELQKRYNASEKLRHKQEAQLKDTKKRSAAQFDEEGDAEDEAERPAKRVQLSQSSPAHRTPAKSTPATPRSAASTSKTAATTPSSAPRSSPKVQSSPQSGSKRKSDTSPSDSYKMARMVVGADRMPTIGEAPSDEEDPNFVVPKKKRAEPELPKDPIIVQYVKHCEERDRERARELKRERWLAAGLTKEWSESEEEQEEHEEQHTEDDEDATVDANGDDAAQNEDDNTARAVAVRDNASDRDEQAEQAQQTTPQRPLEQAVAQTPRGWGFGSIFGSVKNYFTSGGTNAATSAAVPQTEPVRRVANRLDAPATTQTTPTPADKKRRVSAESSRHAVVAEENDEEEQEHDTPETPRHSIGITSKDFVPQTAPQPRRSVREGRNASKEPWSRKHWHERRDAIEAAAKKKKEEEDERRWEAQQREDERLREEAKMLREKWDAERQVGQKRKVRVDDLEVIPRPAPGVYGMNDKYFEEDSDGEVYVDEDEAAKDHVTPPPAKRVKFDTPAGSTQRRRAWETTGLCEVSPHAKTPVFSPSADPHRAQPYTGTMFADPKPDEQFSGDNLFGQSANRDIKQDELDLRSDPVAYGKKYGVWTGKSTPRPKTANREGCFYVPESDSDSDSEVEVEEVTTTQKAPPKTPERSGDGATERVNVFFQKATAETADSASGGLQAPPSPTMSHATLPGLKTPSAIDQQDSAALAKARSEAEKYKPKTPSGLRATSKLSSSPATADNTPTKAGPIPPPKGADSPLPWNGFMSDHHKTPKPTTTTTNKAADVEQAQPKANPFSSLLQQPTTTSTNKVADVEPAQPKVNPFSSLLQQPTSQTPVAAPAANPFDPPLKQSVTNSTAPTTAPSETPGRSLFDRITFPEKAMPAVTASIRAPEIQSRVGAAATFRDWLPALTNNTPTSKLPTFRDFVTVPAQKPTPTPAFQAPNFGAAPAAGTNSFFSAFSAKAKEDTDKMLKDAKAKRKAEEFDSDEDDEAEWERKDAEAQAKKAADLAAAPAFKVPTFGAPAAGGSSNFMSAFSASAQKEAEKAKAKRKAEEFDSDEDDEEEWERKDAEEQAKKKAKFNDSGEKMLMTYVKGVGFTLLPAEAAHAYTTAEDPVTKANAIPVDKLPKHDFTWPICNKPVLDPKTEAAVEAFVNGPEWEKFKKDTYGGFFEAVIAKRAGGAGTTTTN